MTKPNRALFVLIAAAVCCAAAAVAAPSRLSPLLLPPTLRTAEVLTAQVDMRTEGRTVFVTLVGGDRVFRVDVDSEAGLPASFHTDSAQILYWQGHLVVIAPQEARAFHFSILGDQDQPQITPDVWLPRSKRSAADLDRLLPSSYEVTRIEAATAIISTAGPAAGKRHLFLNDDFQDYNPNGSGSGGSSCTQSCPNRSSCSATCPAATGGVTSSAHCSCSPGATCSCS